eukprot:TRINITY_DN56517_c0_g1_i1.p1 TRINITY_DN56517_c0_g1~~TRINITY_DN56517_c0_g1_i1.p1  ORF type:complete len:204 (-),score=25.75 TRINITY_DN56517_c0_g1_i1:118-729(-)
MAPQSETRVVMLSRKQGSKLEAVAKRYAHLFHESCGPRPEVCMSQEEVVSLKALEEKYPDFEKGAYFVAEDRHKILTHGASWSLTDPLWDAVVEYLLPGGYEHQESNEGGPRLSWLRSVSRVKEFEDGSYYYLERLDPFDEPSMNELVVLNILPCCQGLWELFAEDEDFCKDDRDRELFQKMESLTSEFVDGQACVVIQHRVR